MTSTKLSKRERFGRFIADKTPPGSFGAVLIWQFRRILPLSAVYWALFLWNGYFWQGFYHWSADNMTLVFMAGFMVLAAPVHLGDCFSRRQADFIHALPVSRERLYITGFLSTGFSMFLPFVPMVILHRLIAGSFSETIVTLVPQAAIYGTAALAFVYLLAAVCGTWYEYLLVGFAHSLLWPTFIRTGGLVAYGTIPGFWDSYDMETLLLGLLSPMFRLLVHGTQRWNSLAGWMLGLTALLTLLMLWAGLILYRKRKSEHSGTFGKCRMMELVLRIECSLAAAFFTGWAMVNTVRDETPGPWGIPLTLGSIALGLILSWAATGLIYRRSFKKLKKDWLPLAIPSGITVLMLALMSTGLGMDRVGYQEDQLVGADVRESYPGHGEPFAGGMWSPVLVGEEEGSVNVSHMVYSPELLKKVRSLHEKLFELERASQYPYLPGRISYPKQNEVWLYIRTQDDLDSRGGRSHFFTFQGRMTSKARELLDQCQALQMEITTSREMLDGIMPLAAIDALNRVERVVNKGQKYDYGEVIYVEDETRDEKAATESLRKRLDEAIRADIKRGIPDYYNDEGYETTYELIYGGQAFTARGGVLETWDEFGRLQVRSAAGERLKLFIRQGEELPYMRVTPDMEETFAVLEEFFGQKESGENTGRKT